MLRWLEPESLPAIEAALARVQEHSLASHREEVRVERATRRRPARSLARCRSHGSQAGFAATMHRHRDVDAWVDRAYSDAWRGVDEDSLSHGLRAVLDAVRLRRDRHDVEFASGLAAQTMPRAALPDDVLLIEDVLATVVVPLAKEPRPVLLIVADGMSAAVATEIVDDIERRYDSWLECLPKGKSRTERGRLGASLTHRGVPVQPAFRRPGHRSAGRRTQRLRRLHASARTHQRAVPQAQP